MTNTLQINKHCVKRTKTEVTLTSRGFNGIVFRYANLRISWLIQAYGIVGNAI
jgi:hypothetical protein